MRTKTLVIAAALLAAGVASSLAQSNVYSLNVVGYVNTVIVGDAKYTAVANPLDAEANTLGALLGSLPNGSQVLKYNPALSDYESYGKVAFGTGWTGGGEAVSLAPGEGVLILTPAGSANVTNTFVGEVMQGSALTVNLPAGYKMIGNMVPDSGLVSDLGLVPPNGSQLLKWDIGLQDFVGFGKVAFGSGWTPSVPSIGVAEAFFVNAAEAYDWVRDFNVPQN